MSAQYGAPDKKIHPIQPSNGVKIISDEVHLTQSCPNGWAAVIKKRPALVRHYMQACTYNIDPPSSGKDYRRSTIFHCHLIFVGRGKNENENIQHNTKQRYCNAFSGPKLENKKNGEQSKHRNIVSEILWIYGIP